MCAADWVLRVQVHSSLNMCACIILGPESYETAPAAVFMVHMAYSILHSELHRDHQTIIIQPMSRVHNNNISTLLFSFNRLIKGIYIQLG